MKIGENIKNILVVENENDIREMFSQFLSLEGYTVHQAANGEEGLQVLQTTETVSLIFLDLNMPFMNGWEFLKKMKLTERFSNTPVVVTSAYMNVEKRDGICEILSKPFDWKEVREILTKYC
jgi:CheY-like chemotaxis protein